MTDFFASLYEWFGLIAFYSNDLGQHLKGYDITCSAYTGNPLYLSIGAIMVLVTIVFYFLLYHIINSPRFNKKFHWWIMALAAALLNFFIAFTFTYNDLQSGAYCTQLNILLKDCIGFGISNAIWSFIIFVLLTSFPYPRKLAGHNTTHTTFWKP